MEMLDVVVVGAGIVGLTAAIALHQRGYTVAVVDIASFTPHTIPSGTRVYAINQASENLWRALGLWEHFDSQSIAPYQRMYVWDKLSGAHIDFDARMVGKAKLGCMMEESALKRVLMSQALHLGILCIGDFSVHTVRVEPDGLWIGDGKRQYAAKFLMVADGAHSPCRDLLGISITDWSYHQYALVTHVETELPHQHTASQVFNPDGPLAFLPLSNPYHCSIVWSTDKLQAERLKDLQNDQFEEKIAKAFAYRLGHCRVLAPRVIFPLHMRHVKQYSGTRWLCMGDAAHTIHPLAGLGLNIGLADVSAWLALVDAHGWTSNALAQYQRQRKTALWKTIAFMDGIKALFANPLSPIVALRGLGLKMLNHQPLLKRWLIEEASE